MISCDPNALAESAKCFKCLPPVALDWVKTYLLCSISDALSQNLIPDGSFFDAAGRFDLEPLVTRGQTYVLTGGPTEIGESAQLQNDGIATALGDGLPHTFTAGAAGVIRMVEGSLLEPPVTATLYRVL